MKIFVAIVLGVSFLMSGVSHAQEPPNSGQVLNECVLDGMRYVMIADHAKALKDDQKPEFDSWVNALKLANTDEIELIQAFADLAWLQKNTTPPVIGGYKLYQSCLANRLSNKNNKDSDDDSGPLPGLGPFPGSERQFIL